MDREEYKRKKIRYNAIRFKEKINARYGDRCANCGRSEGLEHHHIVPLIYGGTNRESNIVCLCAECHKKAHGNTHRTERDNKGGVKPNVEYVEAESLYEKYSQGEIGMKELKSRLNYKSGTKVSDSRAYRHFLKSRGIKRIVNRVDYYNTLRSQGRKLKDEVLQSRIIYDDGREEVFNG